MCDFCSTPAVLAAFGQQGEHVCALKEEANSEPALYGELMDGFTSDERDPWDWMKAGMRERLVFLTKKPPFILQLGKQNNISRTESNLHDKFRALSISKACMELQWGYILD